MVEEGRGGPMVEEGRGVGAGEAGLGGGPPLIVVVSTSSLL